MSAHVITQLQPEQFADMLQAVWNKINRSDFSYVEKKVLRVIVIGSFGFNQEAAVVPGHDFFVRCEAVSAETHVGAVIKDLAARRIIKYEKRSRVYRGSRRCDWVYGIRVPFESWVVAELPEPARIRQQFLMENLQPADLNDELLRTYIANLRILPKRDDGCIGRGMMNAAPAEELPQASQKGDRENPLASSETEENKSCFTAPPHLSPDGVSLSRPEFETDSTAYQTKKENMHEKDQGSALKPDEGNCNIKSKVPETKHSGTIPLPGRLSGQDPDGGPGTGPVGPVTKNVTWGGGSGSSGPAQPVTKSVTTPQKVPVSWGSDAVTESVVTKKVTAPSAPEQSFPPVPLSKPFNAERSTLNGLWRPVRKTRETERLLMALLLDELGKDEMASSGGMWRVYVVRNLPSDWIEEGIGEVRRMKKCGETFSVNPAATLVDILRKRAGVAHINELPIGAPPV